MQTPPEPFQPPSPAILEFSPRVNRRAGKRHHEPDENGREAELLEAKECATSPNAGSSETEDNRSTWSAIRPHCLRSIAPEKPDGNARQADADEICKIRGCDQPDRVADQQKQNSEARGQQSGDPWHIRRETQRQNARSEPVFCQLRQGSRSARERL